LETQLINGTLRNIAYTPSALVYIALFVGSPLDTGLGGAEVAVGSYARTVSGAWAAPSGGSTSNSATITFPTATASWGTVTHFAIFDNSVGGNMLYWGQLTVAKTVDLGDIFTFPGGNLAVSLD